MDDDEYEGELATCHLCHTEDVLCWPTSTGPACEACCEVLVKIMRQGERERFGSD